MEYLPAPGLSIPERLAVIEQLVGTMNLRLFGNGQPGELATMKNRMEEVENRLTTHEAQAIASNRWWRAIQPIIYMVLGAIFCVVLLHGPQVVGGIKSVEPAAAPSDTQQQRRLP